MSNRTIIGEEVARRLPTLSRVEGIHAVDAVFEAIANELVVNSDVSIRGFGTFSLVHRKARDGRNPRTGETIAVAASIGATFRMHTKLRDALNPKPLVGSARGRTSAQRRRA